MRNAHELAPPVVFLHLTIDQPLYGYLGHPFVKEAPWAFTARLFFVVKGILAIEIAGNRSHGPEKTGLYGQQTIRGGMRRPHERAAKGLLRHDATNWMDLIHQLDARIRGPARACPAVVMVQSTHDRTSDHLLAYLMSGQS